MYKLIFWSIFKGCLTVLIGSLIIFFTVTLFATVAKFIDPNLLGIILTLLGLISFISFGFFITEYRKEIKPSTEQE